MLGQTLKLPGKMAADGLLAGVIGLKPSDRLRVPWPRIGCLPGSSPGLPLINCLQMNKPKPRPWTSSTGKRLRRIENWITPQVEGSDGMLFGAIEPGEISLGRKNYS